MFTLLRFLVRCVVYTLAVSLFLFWLSCVAQTTDDKKQTYAVGPNLCYERPSGAWVPCKTISSSVYAHNLDATAASALVIGLATTARMEGKKCVITNTFLQTITGVYICAADHTWQYVDKETKLANDKEAELKKTKFSWVNFWNGTILGTVLAVFTLFLVNTFIHR